MDRLARAAARKMQATPAREGLTPLGQLPELVGGLMAGSEVVTEADLLAALAFVLKRCHDLDRRVADLESRVPLPVPGPKK